ncbi:MAG: YkgJ family cysteine cluster protein [Calditrichae bacterium]|nr:YkgJ family cysteine cluster protein [Calditrichota bacterium]MCB9058746.1 YkgJ family cysteine cluster protein [Calditrichia bacterium]
MDKHEKPDDKINAGDFSHWLEQITLTQKTNRGMDVPCGTCNACCKASYFIHIQPQETSTLSAIPKELLFPAPGMPKGHMVMGYDKEGKCPMLIKDKCSIYNQRPFTCRNYDCRVFNVTGLKPEDKSKKEILKQSDRWNFNKTSADENKILNALKDAAHFLTIYADKFPVGFVPRNTTQQAILAIKVYKVFLKSTQNLHKSAEKVLEEYVQKVIDELNSFSDN